MKKIILSLCLLAGSTSFAYLSHLDLGAGTVRICKGSVGDTNEIAMRAVVIPTRLKDGSLSLNVVSDFAQCQANTSGMKAWVTLAKPEATNYFGKLVLSNIKLVVASDDGDLISSTDLALSDDQTIHISAKSLRSFGQKLVVGANAHQGFYVDGVLADQNEISFGSVLITDF